MQSSWSYKGLYPEWTLPDIFGAQQKPQQVFFIVDQEILCEIVFAITSVFCLTFAILPGKENQYAFFFGTLEEKTLTTTPGL